MSTNNRLVGLMELLEHNAEAFCRLSSVLGQSLLILQRGAENEDTLRQLAGSLGELQRETQRLGLGSVDKHISRIKEKWFDGRITPTHHEVAELYNRLRDALEERLFVAVPTGMADLYRQQTPLFGEKVDDAFPLSSEDISEAGKCLALGRYTAAVFHLMRVVELGVRHFGDKLGITLTTEKNWQPILDEINKAIKAMDHKLPQTKAYAATSAHLYNVKIAWRNEVMHPKQTYTEEEARAVFTATRTFIRDLASMF